MGSVNKPDNYTGIGLVTADQDGVLVTGVFPGGIVIRWPAWDNPFENIARVWDELRAGKAGDEVILKVAGGEESL